MSKSPNSPPVSADARFVLRTPLLPLQSFLDWTAAGTGVSVEAVRNARAHLRRLIDQPVVREALYLASPGLVGDIPLWEREPHSVRGQKIERALVRYVSRMSTRATPFGLFSGVAVGHVGENTQLACVDAGAYRRSTRLDNDYLFALCSALREIPALREALHWRPNSSLYSLAGRYRYAEARLRGTLRSYHLVAIGSMSYIADTLERARGGASLQALARALVADDPEIEMGEAEAFIDELVESQVLECDLEPAVTGLEPLAGLLAILEAIAPSARVTGVLRGVSARLAALDERGVGCDIAAYEDIEDSLRELPAAIDKARLFQVDLIKPAPEAVLGRGLVDTVARGVEVLRRLTPQPGSGLLDRFREAFRERYESRELPLVEVLDEESGIGFGTSDDPAASGAPLVADLRFAPRAGDGQETWTDFHHELLRRLEHIWAEGGRELVLGDDDIDALSASQPARQPDAFSVLGAVRASSPQALAEGDFEVDLRSAAGPSGARLLGRFCHGSEPVHELVRAHLRAEEALRPEACFAEVVHLNEGRLGNILCRPVLRSYEIPFLGRSGAPPERRLPVQDLLVSVRGERIVLRSRSLDREVVPRLSTAHNFSRRSIGIYRFLCALQAQDGDAVSWSWGPLARARFLPRVRWGRVLFTRARWLLDERALAPLAEAVRTRRHKRAKPDTRTDAKPGEAAAAEQRALAEQRSIFEALLGLREALGLPRHVRLGEGDNELAVDLDNPLSALSFAHLVAKRSSATLYEFDPEPARQPARGPEGRFTHELVLLFTRDPSAARTGAREDMKTAPALASAAVEDDVPARGTPARGVPARGTPAVGTPVVAAAASAVPRSFAPGGPWLYLKLYTGVSTADTVLRDVIAPVRELAFDSGAAQQWFFLRYHDTGPHLRVRFRGPPGRLYSEVLPAAHAALQPLIEDGSVWRVQIDTYERELERYGGAAGIELYEEIFWHDSDAVLDIVELLEGDAGADARWRLALRGADMLLDDFGMSTRARRELMARARDSFRAEFRADTAMFKKIGERFRAERGELERLLGADPADDAASDLAPGLELLARRSERVRAAIGAYLDRVSNRDSAIHMLERCASSVVHMHVNRMLHVSQRAQELVLYDFLHRWYAARSARKTTLTKSTEK